MYLTKRTPTFLALGLPGTAEAAGATAAVAAGTAEAAAGVEDVLLTDVVTAAEAVVAEGAALVVVAGAVAAACGSQVSESASAVLTKRLGDQANSIIFASVARVFSCVATPTSANALPSSDTPRVRAMGPNPNSRAGAQF
jgi:uncharacterized Zn-binding protein involved in type VI secretion